MRDRKYRFVKYGAYALITIGLFVLQTTRGLQISVFGVSPDYMTFYVAAIALLEGYFPGGCFGVFAGLLISLSSVMVEGLEGLYLGLFGVLCGCIGNAYMRKVPMSGLFCGACGILLKKVIGYIFYYGMVFAMPLSAAALQCVIEIAVSVPFGLIVFLIARAVNRYFREDE